MGSIAVVYNQDITTLSVPDGVIIDVMTPTPLALIPQAADSVAYCGTASWGVFDAVGYISDTGTLGRTYGSNGVGPYDLPTFASLALELGVTDLRLVRVGDGTESAAVLPVFGANSAIGSAVGLFEGSLVNGASIILTYSPTTPAAMQQTSGNAQKVYIDVTVTVPNGDSEVYQGLDGNVLAGGVFNIDGPTLASAIQYAFANGVPNGRGSSAYFVFAPAVGTVPGAPIIGTPNYVTAPGSDGSAFAEGSPNSLDAAMLGSNESTPFTGMYAFSGHCSGSALALCGDSSPQTLGGLMDAFCKAQNACGFVSFPDGTASVTAITEKNLYGLQDNNLTVWAGDYTEFTDSVNGAIQRFVDPAPVAAARYALTAVQRSPANLPIPVINGTTRTGSIQNFPYSDTEALQLENAGINFISNDTAGNVGFAIRHNKNSLGKTAGYAGNMAYTHVLQFLIESYQSKLIGALVGEDQGFTSQDDDVRSSARALFNGFLQLQQDDNVIDAFNVKCDLQNNRPGFGLLRVDTRVQQREVIDNVAVGLISGLGVVAQVTSAASLTF